MRHSTVVEEVEREKREAEEASPDAVKPTSMGTSNRTSPDNRELRAEEERQYGIEMKRKLDAMPRCYIDCHYFSKWNMVFFLILLVTQMLQSMGFNCVFDLPQLFLLLLFLPWYSFRKKAFTAYSFYLLFFVAYCALSVYVKMTYAILIHT